MCFLYSTGFERALASRNIFAKTAPLIYRSMRHVARRIPLLPGQPRLLLVADAALVT